MATEGEATAVVETAGSLLRQARLASGMHIAALAVSLKVPVSKLEALEADNYTVLPDTVFTRALASSVCRTLKIDPAPILALLPQSQSPRLSSHSAGLNAPVRTGGGRLSAPASSTAAFSSSTASRSVTFVVLALLVGALVIFLYPRMPQEGASSSFTPGPEEGPAAVTAPVPAELPSTSATEPAAATATAETPAAGASAPAAAPAPAAQSAAAPALATAAAGQTQPLPGAATVASTGSTPPSGTLVLRARSQSWVQVRDGAGAVVLQRNLGSGETVSVGAPAPLSVVVGRADATEVFVRGKPFELISVARDNVARFEVK